MAVTSLTWQQVNAWRLSQHCLSPRLKREDALRAVSRTGGIQAQVMSAAELAIGARVDGLNPQDVQSALSDHTGTPDLYERVQSKGWGTPKDFAL